MCSDRGLECVTLRSSDAVSGWAGCALAHPEFGSSVNLIPTKGADYAHHITACQPGFENLTTSLSSYFTIHNRERIGLPFMDVNAVGKSTTIDETVVYTIEPS